MVTLDRLTEAVCLEDVEDRFVDMCLAADPGMISPDYVEDFTVVDEPGNDVDTLAGADYEADEIEVPDDDGFTPSAYDALIASHASEIADEDLPEDSPLSPFLYSHFTETQFSQNISNVRSESERGSAEERQPA